MNQLEIKNNWQKYKAVIFDVDGTVYNLPKMHRYIFFAMLKYFLIHPWRAREIFIIHNFRKKREILASTGADNIAERQYAEVAEKMKIEKLKVIKVIDFWMGEKPLEYIEKCLNWEVRNLIDNLAALGILIIYFSDYDPVKKVKRLGLKHNYFFNAGSPEIDALKPSEKGLKYILQKLNLSPTDCFLIGDRGDKDGIIAKKMGIEYLIVK